MEDHDYDEKNINTCKECKKIYEKYGQTDAQINEPHTPEPIEESNNDDEHNYDVPSLINIKKRKSKENYDLPGYDIRHADELGDSSRNVRLKKEYSDPNTPAPASQLDAFELYGGIHRRRKTHKRRKTHRKRKIHRRKTHRKKMSRKSKKSHRK